MKKHLTFRNLGALLLLVLPFWTFAHTDTFDEVTKTIVKEFNIDSDAKIAVNNKYGKIEVRSWDQNKVKFEIEVRVEAHKDEKAKKRLESITVEFSGDEDNVEAITKFGTGDRKDSWWSNWWKGDKKNVKIRVNYVIHLPQSALLEVSNKYGNVSVPTMNNDLHLNLKYGDATIEDVQGMFHCHLSYGKAKVGNVSDLDLSLSYGGFDAMSTGDAHIHSKHSKITLSEALDLDWQSKYDDIHIGTASSLTNEGRYDNFHIELIGRTSIDTKHTAINISEIQKSFDFDTGYGSITLQRLSDGFSDGNILSRHTKIVIEESSDIQYLLEMQKLDPCLSSSFVKEKSHNEKKYRFIEGYLGSKRGGKVTIEATYGSIEIK